MPFSYRQNVPPFTNPLVFQSGVPGYTGKSELPNRIQPRPLNPELDIHFGRDSPYIPSPHHSFSREPSSVPQIPQHVWRESDYQLATVPSTSLEASMEGSLVPFVDREMESDLEPSLEPSLRSSDDEDATRLNEFLKKSGLPTFDFSVLTDQNKDRMVSLFTRSNVVPRLYLPHRGAIWTSRRCDEEGCEALLVCTGRQTDFGRGLCGLRMRISSVTSINASSISCERMH